MSDNTLQNNCCNIDEENEIKPNYLELIRQLNEIYLNALHEIFKEKSYIQQFDKYDLNKGLNKEEFVYAINTVFGNIDCNFSAISIELFNDINQEQDTIVWDTFLDFIINSIKSNYEPVLELSISEYLSPPHAKKETITNIVLIETNKYFCYAIVTKHGRVGLYDGNLNFLTTYSIIMSKEDVNRTDDERRKRNRWVTDALFLTDVQMFVVANSARSLNIYDASGLKHILIYLILGFPNIVNSIAYRYSKTLTKSALCFGLENGQILMFNFQKPNEGLLKRKHNDKLSVYYYQEMRNEKEFVIIKNLGNSHKEAIKSVQYYTNSNTIISCSQDTKKSLIIRAIDNKQEPYIFKMRRGTSCFSISNLLKLLVTGSDDGTIRIWNSVMTSKPLSVFNAHKAGIVDVVIFEDLNVFFSISRDAVLKLWDLKEQRCIKTINLKFPPFQIMGKSIEWGLRNIYPGPKQVQDDDFVLNQNEAEQASIINQIDRSKWERKYILISCCNYIAKINLFYMDGKSRNFDLAVLPPPPLQNSVLIPINWKILDKEQSSKNDNIEPINISEDDLEKYMNKLKFILDKNIIKENNLSNDINYKIATLESKKLHMMSSVEKYAPYLALDLYEIEDIKLSPNLPVPNNKKIRNLVDKTQKMLNDAEARSIIFSDPSTYSKSPRSTKSSIIDFD